MSLRENITEVLRQSLYGVEPEKAQDKIADAILAAISSEPAAVLVERKAPVQGCQAGIPWSLHLEAYDDYAKKYGTSQTAERLAERGGFGTRELDEHIPGWREKVSAIAALQALMQEQKLTIQALMSGMPEGSTTTPVIRHIADLQARLEAAEKALAGYRSADEHSHLCRDCSHAYTPVNGTCEDCPKCGSDGTVEDIDAALSKKAGE